MNAAAPQLIEASSPHVMNTYGRVPIALSHGQGCRVWDINGKEYLDALAGIAVNTLGHNHPKLVPALQDQITKIIHSCNYYHVPGQEQLATKLVERSGMTNVFFCSTGLEANEAALKLARKFGHDKGIERPEIVVYEKAFHGRSIATLSATGNEKVQKGFGPLVEGFIRVPLNDIEALKQATEGNPNVVAVFFETIQGEGGINAMRAEYLRQVRQLCDEHDWLMMIDEVQCGMGRTGKWFAHQWADIKPDVMPLAKGLGSGVPIGAVVAGPRAAHIFQPGNHGTTFGGNPLAMRAGVETIRIMEEDGLLANAAKVGAHLKGALERELSLKAPSLLREPVMSLKHYLQFTDLTAAEYAYLFERAALIKKKFKAYEKHQPLVDRTLAMIFEKASTRTRVSFEAGMYQLGGSVVHLTTGDSQLGRAEPIEDSARVISRMVDLVMIRTYEQTKIERFAEYSRVPVINGLTNEYHPCQILADIFTFIEHRGSIKGKTVTWVGDGNNMANTWLQAAELLGFTVHVSTPGGYEVNQAVAGVQSDCYKVFQDPMQACTGADLVTTDVWTSMGYEAENEARKKAFADWCVDADMMRAAKSDALFMHCLPAHRGEEVEAEVIDGPQSVVWDEAENRLHVQKALMEYLLLGTPQ